MSETEISVIIPSYLEEENLRVILPRIVTTLESLNITWEINIIDTLKSMDYTEAVCRQYGVNYYNREGSNEYGSAVRTGIAKANGKYLLFMDADGSHSPEMISQLFEFRREYDVVIASRYVEGGGSDNSKSLILMSLIVNKIFSLVLGLNCKDVSNSFKIYRSEQLKGINLYCHEFDIIEEILVKLKRKFPALKLKEVPYVFKERMWGHTKRNLFVFMLLYIKTLLVLKFRK
jgi:dolichol-phosphate mannosyltransferase